MFVERWFPNLDVGLLTIEACGSALRGGGWLNGLGIEVKLPPAAYIRAYVKRNETDAAALYAPLLYDCIRSPKANLSVSSFDFSEVHM